MASSVLVTGGTGFIGSAVVRALCANGRSVRVLVQPGQSTKSIEGLAVDAVEGDLLDERALDRAMSGCDAVYHLAAIYKHWVPDPTVIYRVNVEGTTGVLLAALRHRVRRVVYTSSIAALGITGRPEPADEETPFNTFDSANDYVLSKYLAERVALRFAREGLPLVVVNPTFPFGRGDNAPTPTGAIILALLEGRVPGRSVGGFNAVNVDDVAQGHLAAEERGRVGERYVLGDHDVTFGDFFDVVSEVSGCKNPRLVLPGALPLAVAWVLEKWGTRVQKTEPIMTYRAMKYGNQYLWWSPEKARRELGLRSTPLRDTVTQAVQWFRENGYVGRKAASVTEAEARTRVPT